MKPPTSKKPSSEFDAFKDMTRKLLAVPKEEVKEPPKSAKPKPRAKAKPKK
jgi:hypothetical protein